MNYEETIHHLFALLELANLGDSDIAEHWQHEDDPYQHPKYFYGAIHNAIEAIAGPEILEHWCTTSEIDINLANRIQKNKTQH